MRLSRDDSKFSHSIAILVGLLIVAGFPPCAKSNTVSLNVKMTLWQFWDGPTYDQVVFRSLIDPIEIQDGDVIRARIDFEKEAVVFSDLGNGGFAGNGKEYVSAYMDAWPLDAYTTGSLEFRQPSGNLLINPMYSSTLCGGCVGLVGVQNLVNSGESIAFRGFDAIMTLGPMEIWDVPVTQATVNGPMWVMIMADQISIIPQNAPIPEPSTAALVGIGIVGLIGYGWRWGRS
jgi:hypothetical protein